MGTQSLAWAGLVGTTTPLLVVSGNRLLFGTMLASPPEPLRGADWRHKLAGLAGTGVNGLWARDRNGGKALPH